MKKIEVLLSMLILLAFGYSEVKFEESQPRELNQLQEFPDELVGSYIDTEGNTTTLEKDKLETQLFTVDLNRSEQEVQLKRYKDYFFLNALEDHGWEVLVIEKTSANMIQLRTIGDLDDEELMSLARITPTKITQKEGLAINPKITELEQIIESDFFDEVTRMKRIS